MDIKKLLKNIKLNESTISMVLGVVVILVVGALIYRYFTGLNSNDVSVPAISTEQTEEGIRVDELGREIYTVAEGDSLWSIAEDKLASGFDYLRIAEVNNLTGDYSLETGQELILPVAQEEPEATAEAESTIEPSETVDEGDALAANIEEQQVTEEEPMSADTANEIQGTNYTVVRGDTLWDIAVRAYGDGYRWTDIADANDLANPSIIHAGNEFVLPR